MMVETILLLGLLAVCVVIGIPAMVKTIITTFSIPLFFIVGWGEGGPGTAFVTAAIPLIVGAFTAVIAALCIWGGWWSVTELLALS